MNPPPGTATEDDLIRLNDHEDRICELVDRVLIEKAYDFWDSCVNCKLIGKLANFVGKGNGVIAGPAGPFRLRPGLVRIPDASFTRMSRLKELLSPTIPILPIAPDLAIELDNRQNTELELRLKLNDYFNAGTLEVWSLSVETGILFCYYRSGNYIHVPAEGVFDKSTVLPNFRLRAADLLAPLLEPNDRSANSSSDSFLQRPVM